MKLIFDSSPPALSSFGEERENYFVGRFPRVFALHQSARTSTPGLISFTLAGLQFGYARIRGIRVSPI
jgi:hypothetical protein